MKKMRTLMYVLCILLCQTFALIPARQTKAADPHNLSDFGYRTVVTGGRGDLVFQTEPGGSFLSDYRYSDGESIYVNLTWRENGYTLAYENGVFGFVDAGYINWGTPYDPHNLSDFDYRTVVTGGTGDLVFQTEPGGSFLADHRYANGQSIYVNVKWTENGYGLAYDNGVYGFVDAGYIDWGTAVPAGGTTGPGDPHTLSDYGYRTVNTGGRGALVFQTSPGGSFMEDYRYNDGDSIYVNLTWRQNGYAMAYSGGVYGYVDASYINWGSGTTPIGPDPYTLSNYGYRTVNTGGRGALVFQTAPGGSFMEDYRYNDGDSIYVNLTWRQSGYTMAYSGGVYGYVDASYINW